jgi:hypothetical protein
MKNIFTSIFILVALIVNAQTSDSVTTGGDGTRVSEVYYDFETGTQVSLDRTLWDIGFTSDQMNSSIIINENAGVELYLYSADTADWSTVDTSGFSFEKIYNSEETWASGAFSNQETNHPDYGWGIYNMNTHDILGNRLFIVKTQSGDYLKVVIDKLDGEGVWFFRTAMLDGSIEKAYEYAKSTEESLAKNFALLNISSGVFDYSNADTKAWDILFTKYVTTVQMGPTSQDMAVSGVKINAGCEVAERAGEDVTSNDTSSLTWGTSITEIGYDWKSFNRGTFQYEFTADLAYFVRTQNGAVWKIWFTGYEGGAVGKYVFNTEEIKAGVSNVNKYAKLKTSVYPNPTRDVLNITNEENEALNIKVMNTQGAVMLESSVNAFETTSFNTTDLAKGIYFLQLSTANATSTQRVIFE